MRQTRLFVIPAILLAACTQQTPAPIVSGYAYQAAYNSRPSVSAPRVIQEDVVPVKRAEFYTVKRGDTLSKIGEAHSISTRDLVRINGLRSANNIHVGQRLRVTRSASAAPTLVADRGLSQAALDAKSTIAAQETELSYNTYKVQKGDNLFRIGLQHGVSALDIMAANDLDRPQSLIADSTIRIPVNTVADNSSEVVVAQINRDAARAKGFSWPAKGKVVETFGRQGEGVNNTGIKIALNTGDPIYSAEAGTVIYADSGLRSYGNLVLLRHQNGLITAYAHGSQLMVKKGDKVVKGQLVALAGQSGNASSPMLHFEVRRNARSIDPLTILPKQDANTRGS